MCFTSQYKSIQMNTFYKFGVILDYENKKSITVIILLYLN